MLINRRILLHIVLTLGVCLIIFSAAIIWGSNRILSDFFIKKSVDQLYLIRDLNQQKLDFYLNNIKSQIQLFSDQDKLRNAFKDLKFAFEQILMINEENSTIVGPHPSLNLYYNNLAKKYENYFHNSEINPTLEKANFATVLQNLNQRSINLQSKYLANVHNNIIISDYMDIHEIYHNYLLNIVNENKYQDLFLIDFNGNVVYSSQKNIDFSSSVLSPAFVGSEINLLFNQIKYATSPEKTVFLSNFSEYFPDYQEPVCFFGKKIDNIGIIIVSLQISQLEDLVKLPEQYGGFNLYLLDQDSRLMSADHFGKFLGVSGLISDLNIDEKKLIKNIKADKASNISSVLSLKEINLNLVVTTPKFMLLGNLVKPLVSMFYFTLGVIFLALLGLYGGGVLSIITTDKKFNKISDFMKKIIAKKDLSSRIKMNNDELPSNIADILNSMLSWFQVILNQVGLKIKKFVEKYNELLHRITIVSENYYKENMFFADSVDLVNQVEGNGFKIQHEVQQYGDLLDNYKNLMLDFNEPEYKFDVDKFSVKLDDIFIQLLQVFKLSRNLSLQIYLEGKKLNNAKTYGKVKALHIAANQIKLKLAKLKNGLNDFKLERTTSQNVVNSFYAKLNNLKFNFNCLIEKQKSVLLTSNEQLCNLDRLQRELRNLELKYNTFKQQLLDIVASNSKLNAESPIEGEEPITLKAVESKHM